MIAAWRAVMVESRRMSAGRPLSSAPSTSDGAGIVRDELGAYDIAWYAGGALCVVAGVLSLLVRWTAVPAPV